MTRREALIALLCAICLAVLPGCSDDERTVGGENGPVRTTSARSSSRWTR